MKALLFLLALIFISVGMGGADEINGRITAIDLNAGTIGISGVTISAASAKIINDLDNPVKLSDLKLHERVEIEGSFTGSGCMQAKKIQMDAGGGYDKIVGKISQASSGPNQVTIGGIKVSVPDNSTLEDQQGRPIKFDKLTAGITLKCKGLWTGPKQFMTRHVELD